MGKPVTRPSAVYAQGAKNQTIPSVNILKLAIPKKFFDEP